MKRQTFRFYTDSGHYKGWKYLRRGNYTELLNWIRSGNYVMINAHKITWINRQLLFLNSFYDSLLKKED